MNAEQRFKKWIADNPGLTKSAIKKSDFFRSNYKTIAKNQKIAIEKFLNWQSEIAEKQWNRQYYKLSVQSSINDRLKEKRMKEWREFFKQNYRHSVNESIRVSFGSDFSYFVGSELNWNGYAKSCRYPKKEYHVHITIPNGHSIPKIEKTYFDGIPNWHCQKIRSIGNTAIYRVVILSEKKGFEKNFQWLFVAESKNFSYHAKTISKSIRGLKRKIKHNEKLYNLSLDTSITKSDYAKLTGACPAGINQFCNKHGLTGSSITIRELLPLLEQDKAYGLPKIKKMLSKEPV
jgi:hypothetical protein